MPFLAAIGYLVLFVAFLAGLGATGLYLLIELPRWLKRRALPGPAAKERRIAVGAYPQWLAGDDLLSYPGRLAELEDRLGASLVAVQEQTDHLRGRRDRIAAKEGRSELAERYESDAQMLDHRASRMRRVLALVWRTRAILLLRAHVAITARRRPALESLPEGDIPAGNLERAQETYETAAAQVRAFVVAIESRMADLHLTVPSVPDQADLTDDDREAVDLEVVRARDTYTTLESKLDKLADTLSYLGDRCRTRLVVEDAPTEVEAEPGSEQLVDEVNAALGALNDLAELGDRQLADTALDNLAEGISQLEHAGLEAQAEADAALEIERLLEQFPR